MSSVCRAQIKSGTNCVQTFYVGSLRGAALGVIRWADWTEPQPAASVGGAAGTLAAEGMMIHIADTCSFTVDKNKTKGSSCQQHAQHQAHQPNQSNGPPDVVPASVEDERKNHRIQQLTGILAASNCRFEAMTVVLQQTLVEVRLLYYGSIS